MLWSLSVEETFYLAFPLVCLLLRRERLIMLALLVLIAIGPLSRMLTEGESWDEYAYLSCLDCTAFGCLAAWMHERARRADSAQRLGWMRVCWSAGALLICAVVVLRETVASLGLVDSGLYVTLLALGTSLVLWTIAEACSDTPLPGSSWLRTVGRSSYEIYLTHMFLVFATVALFRASQLELSAWVFAFTARAARERWGWGS